MPGLTTQLVLLDLVRDRMAGSGDPFQTAIADDFSQQPVHAAGRDALHVSFLGSTRPCGAWESSAPPCRPASPTAGLESHCAGWSAPACVHRGRRRTDPRPRAPSAARRQPINLAQEFDVRALFQQLAKGLSVIIVVSFPGWSKSSANRPYRGPTSSALSPIRAPSPDSLAPVRRAVLSQLSYTTSRDTNKDFEVLCETSETWIRIAMIQIMAGRLAKATCSF